MNAKESATPPLGPKPLQRILATVAAPKRNRGLEVLCDVILALITTASA